MAKLDGEKKSPHGCRPGEKFVKFLLYGHGGEQVHEFHICIDVLGWTAQGHTSTITAISFSHYGKAHVFSQFQDLPMFFAKLVRPLLLAWAPAELFFLQPTPSPEARKMAKWMLGRRSLGAWSQARCAAAEFPTSTCLLWNTLEDSWIFL